jgi:hypothetical protein
MATATPATATQPSKKAKMVSTAKCSTSVTLCKKLLAVVTKRPISTITMSFVKEYMQINRVPVTTSRVTRHTM